MKFKFYFLLIYFLFLLQFVYADMYPLYTVTKDFNVTPCNQIVWISNPNVSTTNFNCSSISDNTWNKVCFYKTSDGSPHELASVATSNMKIYTGGIEEHTHCYVDTGSVTQYLWTSISYTEHHYLVDSNITLFFNWIDDSLDAGKIYLSLYTDSTLVYYTNWNVPGTGCKNCTFSLSSLINITFNRIDIGNKIYSGTPDQFDFNLLYLNFSTISTSSVNNLLPSGTAYYNDSNICYDGPSYEFPFYLDVSDPEGNTIYYSTTTYAANYSKYDYFTSWDTIGICPACISYPYGSFKEPIYTPYNVTYDEDYYNAVDGHVNYILPVKDLTWDDMYGLYMPEIDHRNWIGIPLDRSLTNFNYQTDIKGLSDTEELNITFYSSDLVKFKDFRFWRNSTNLCVDADLSLLGCVGNYNDFRFKYNTLPTYNDSYITITPSNAGIFYTATTFNMSTSQPDDTNMLKFYYYTYLDDIIILNYDIVGLTYMQSWSTTKPSSVSLRKGYNNVNILITDSVHLGSSYNYFNFDVYWHDEAYCQYYNINQPNTTNYSYYNYSQNNYTYTGNYSTIQPDRVIFDLLRPPLQYYYDTMGWSLLAMDALYIIWIFIFVSSMISVFFFTKSLSFTTPMVTASSLCLICSLALNSISHILTFSILIVFALTGPFILNFFNSGYNN